MKFGDTLIAAKPLSPGTLSEIRNIGNTIEGTSAFVRDTKSGMGVIHAYRVFGRTLDFRKVRQNYYYCHFFNDSTQSIPNDTPTDFTQLFIKRYNAGFPTNASGRITDGKFIFKQAGYYRVQVSAGWDAGATGYRRIIMRAFSGNYTGRLNHTFAANANVTAHQMRGEIYVEKDSVLMINCYQNSGAPLDFEFPNIAIRLVST